jgi:hypothetical protein
MTLKFEFVELMPKQFVEGVLYVSMEYATAIHLCACGCGNKVVTPLSLKDWILTYNGEQITLSPSIGNWNFPCRSHYWIVKNLIKWEHEWLDKTDVTRFKNKLKGRKHHKSLWQKIFGE